MGLVRTFPAYAQSSGSSSPLCTEIFQSTPPFNNLVLLSVSQMIFSLRLIDQNFVRIPRLLLLFRIPCPPPASLFECRIPRNREAPNYTILYSLLSVTYLLGSNSLRILLSTPFNISHLSFRDYETGP